MRTYTLDIDPEQLVFWTRAELSRTPSRLRATASRGWEPRKFDKRGELRFGDAESEDLSEIATVANLVISPVDSQDGWSVSVLVEDEAGARGPEESVEGPEEEIDLESFYELFIRPGRGTVYVAATVEDSTAQGRATRFLNDVLNDRHRGASAARGH